MATTPNITNAIANKYSSTLSAGISDTDLTITVADGTGLSSTGGFIIIDEVISGSREIVHVESVSGNTLTISSDGRGQEGTAAAAHNAGAAVTDILVQNQINGINDQFKQEHSDAGAHTGIAAALVVSGTAISTSNKIIDESTYASGTAVLDNDAALQGKEVGGTAREIAKVNTDDQIQLGNGTNEVAIKTIAKFSAIRSTTQIISIGSGTEAVIYDSEEEDVGGDYDNTTGEFTVPTTGTYLITGSIGVSNPGEGKPVQGQLKVDGTAIRLTTDRAYNASEDPQVTFATTYPLTAGEVVTFECLQDAAVTLTVAGAGATWFSAHLISIT
jgi:hypothetical protein